MSDETIVQFFDEMNILRSEKNIRVETARSFKKKVQTFFNRQLNDLRRGYFLALYNEQDYEDYLIELYMFYATDKTDRYMILRAQRWAEEVQTTTYNAIVNYNDGNPLFSNAVLSGESLSESKIPEENTIFSNAVLNGESLSESEIPEEILELFSPERAERIAINESIVINNHLRHEELRETQYTHTWETMKDEKVRPYHMEADGQTVPIDEPFVVGGELLMFPGDDSMGASPQNLINCRCFEL